MEMVTPGTLEKMTQCSLSNPAVTEKHIKTRVTLMVDSQFLHFIYVIGISGTFI